MATAFRRMTNHHVPNEWSDHDLLTAEYHPPYTQSTGTGPWRLNPQFLNDKIYLDMLEDIIANWTKDTALDDAANRWEELKIRIKIHSKQYGKDRKQRMKRERKRLTRERARWRDRLAHAHTMEDTSLVHDATTQLTEVNKKLGSHITDSLETLHRRAATKWQEDGERSTKYFYRCIKDRATKRTLSSIEDQDTVHTSITDMHECARKFYGALYNPDRTALPAQRYMVDMMRTGPSLTAADQAQLVEPLTMPQLKSYLRCLPNNKIPGPDGLPYEIYNILIDDPRTGTVLLTVLNDALTAGICPQSWHNTIMILLFKKGNPGLLKNWRPLSLINSNAKLFTKIVADRMQPLLQRLISPIQTGFIRKRHISDNGILMTNAMHIAERLSLQGAIVLLDQEKAYDRVHHDYLLAVLQGFNFPTQWATRLILFFGSTRVHLNINGHIATPFVQKRGLRQGDPFVAFIVQRGYRTTHPIDPWRSSPAGTYPIDTALSADDDSHQNHGYADDIAVILRDPLEWSRQSYLIYTALLRTPN